MDTVKVYTLDEVAEILHTTRRTLYTYLKEGKLKAVKIGRKWIITEENLKDFISRGTREEE